jgi:hypothetical protein
MPEEALKHVGLSPSRSDCRHLRVRGAVIIRIETLIAASDMVVFVLSPDSLLLI